MNVNKFRFGSVLWIVVTCIVITVNVAGFTVLVCLQLFDCSGNALYNCAFLINIYRSK